MKDFGVVLSRIQRSTTRGVSFLLASVVMAPRLCAAPGETVPVSVGILGYGPTGWSDNAVISSDGRFIAFESGAPDLVPGDFNGVSDVFVFDRLTGMTKVASVSSTGALGMLRSHAPSISGDGRFVAFASESRNFVAGDFYQYSKVFVHDMLTGLTELVSTNTLGGIANGESLEPSISSDGRFVAFTSTAWDIVPNDSPDSQQVFERNLELGKTVRVSENWVGVKSNWPSTNPSISGDGRYVAFESKASNLVGGTNIQYSKIFLREVPSNAIFLASATSNYQVNVADCFDAKVSDSGQIVAFRSVGPLVAADTNNIDDIYVRDNDTNITTLVSVGPSQSLANGPSSKPSISGNGRYIAFSSAATNIVPLDNNGVDDIFVHDSESSTTWRVSEGPTGAPANGASGKSSMSYSGRYMAYWSGANNLAAGDFNNLGDVFLCDQTLHATTRVTTGNQSALGAGSSYICSVSNDGRWIAFSSSAANLVVGDTNNKDDIFLRDMALGTTTRVSVGSTGAQSNNHSSYPDISGDGRYVAFASTASNLVAGDVNGRVDIFVRDQCSGTVSIESVSALGAIGDSNSFSPSLSYDGRFIAFASDARNLLPGDTNYHRDVFVRDRVLGTTVLISTGVVGAVADGDSSAPIISANGKYVVFSSSASNLVPNDTNNKSDVFLRNLETGITTRISVSDAGVEGNEYSYASGISADGRIVAYYSLANNLVPGDSNYSYDIFLHDTQSNTTRLISYGINGSANLSSDSCAISADGRIATFMSSASNLVPGDDNHSPDVFSYDDFTGTLNRVSSSTEGLQANNGSYDPCISGDGRFVAYISLATNLTADPKSANTYDAFRRELQLPNIVKGAISIPGYRGGMSDLAVDFALVSSDGESIPIRGVNINPDGTFVFSTAAIGTYHVLARVQGSLWRSNLGDLHLSSGTFESVNFSLVLGDCSGDNYVGTDDYLIFVSAMDSVSGDSNYDPRADLDGDGSVGTDDYLLLSANFDTYGDE